MTLYSANKSCCCRRYPVPVVPNLLHVNVLDPDWGQDFSIIKYLCQNLEAVGAPTYIGITLFKSARLTLGPLRTSQTSIVLVK